MRVPVSGATALVASGIAIALAIVQSLSSTIAQTPNRVHYLPEYTASGDLILPKDFHEWVYLGSPLTPNALNGGMAGFPEFHDVYIEPGSHEVYTQTNRFPEGTIMFKELQLTQPGENPDGSRTEPWGRGYFPWTRQSGDGAPQFLPAILGLHLDKRATLVKDVSVLSSSWRAMKHEASRACSHYRFSNVISGWRRRATI
jgi:hypothetical protein